MFEAFFDTVGQITPIKEDLKEKLTGFLQRKTVPRKTILLREGQTCNYIFFIEKGLIRSYYLKGADEICSWFMKENDLAIAVNSFYTRTPSYEFLQALEDTTYYSLHYDNLQSLYREFVDFNKVGRVLTERYYVLCEERTLALRKQRAEDRYKQMLQTEPDLVGRVPRKDIASYLGISLETLSRIRAK